MQDQDIGVTTSDFAKFSYSEPRIPFGGLPTTHGDIKNYFTSEYYHNNNGFGWPNYEHLQFDAGNEAIGDNKFSESDHNQCVA
jgi:hypothetical protein